VLLGVVGLAVAGLAACSSPPSAPKASFTSASPTPSPSSTNTVTPVLAVAPASVLSGRPGAKNGPVLVVKMDNTYLSEPHFGIKDADVVYMEQVEGGLSRYAVVFSSVLPAKIGPVRSARISDIELFQPYGRVAFAYSGAQPRLITLLHQANLAVVAADDDITGYARDYSRRAPDNLFAYPSALLKRAGGSVPAKDVGFRFARVAQPGGTPAASVTTGFPATRVGFTWSPTQQRWLATMNGSATHAAENGAQLGGTTVIIQYVTVSRTDFLDSLGNYTPLSTTVGSGKALILRDGKAYDATWSRAGATAVTHWRVGGKDFPLAPGQVWVLLIDKYKPAVVTP
jgi:hypothetical protein